MQQTPRSNQLHIGIFGRCNVGKSTLMNHLLGQDLAITSPLAGTTTDSVSKSIEWHPLGPVVLVDTAGIDDTSILGAQRIARTRRLIEEMDFCLWVVDSALTVEDKEWLEYLQILRQPYVMIYNRKPEDAQEVDTRLGQQVVWDARCTGATNQLKRCITQAIGEIKDPLCIGDQLEQGDVVVLVTPQDQQAPKGRLILPQVQVAREILDQKAIPIMTTVETLSQTLQMLSHPPKWLITDSQVFDEVKKQQPEGTKLTSFSILMARVKGDLAYYESGLESLPMLCEGDNILIAESCTHNPLHQDIAREKLPQALCKHLGKTFAFEWVSGKSFPEDVSAYKLIIHCGGCMHTPRQIKARIDRAKRQKVPMTNFGVLLAYLSGSTWDTMQGK